MSTPYVGEIRMFAGNFAPSGWAFCDGSLMAISDNDALFNLIGTTYGGDGQTTFALPDLRGRLPIHVGTGFALAQTGGAETVTLTTAQIPPHVHTALGGTEAASESSPAGAAWAAWPDAPYTNSTSTPVAMDPGAIGQAGSSQPHDNMVPFLAVNFILSLFGVYPSAS